MGMIKIEDIAGYLVGYQNTELVCSDCIKDEETKDIREEQIITEDMIEDGETLFFCNRCRKKI